MAKKKMGTTKKMAVPVKATKKASPTKKKSVKAKTAKPVTRKAKPTKVKATKKVAKKLAKPFKKTNGEQTQAVAPSLEQTVDALKEITAGATTVRVVDIEDIQIGES